MTQQSHYWAYTQRKPQFKKIHAPQSSFQFTIARTWKQPRCLLTDEWIKILWYIYTMEHYSAIKSNEFEALLVRWMNVELVMQSEVNQKEKIKYHMQGRNRDTDVENRLVETTREEVRG